MGISRSLQLPPTLLSAIIPVSQLQYCADDCGVCICCVGGGAVVHFLSWHDNMKMKHVVPVSCWWFPPWIPKIQSQESYSMAYILETLLSKFGLKKKKKRVPIQCTASILKAIVQVSPWVKQRTHCPHLLFIFLIN